METWQTLGRYVRQFYVQPMKRGGRKLALASLVALILFSLTGSFVSTASHAQSVTHAKTKPNQFDPKSGTKSVLHRPQAPVDPPFHTSTTPHPIGHPGPTGMQPG